MTSSPTASPSASGLPPGALRPDLEHSHRPLPPEEHMEASALALRKAWGIYFALAVIPPLAMIMSIFYLIFAPSRGPDVQVVGLANNAGWGWFLVGMGWIAVWVPISFYLRARYWEAYGRGELVQPSDYLKGNLAIWLPLVIAGVIGFIGFASTRYVASLFTSVMAFMIFQTMFPNGHAMTRPVGDHDDPGVYEDPK